MKKFILLFLLKNNKINQYQRLKSKAFSLIELSIVVLIIGILIAGVTQGSRMVRQARLKTAQNQTSGSPVSSIPNLAAWWETTMEGSITSTTNGTSPENQDLVSSWNDINTQNNSKNATNIPSGNNPIYTENGMNGLPVVTFSGGKYNSFDGSILVASDYTIFVVEQRSSNAVSNYFMAGSASALDANMHLGYRTNTVVTQAQYADDISVTLAGSMAAGFVSKTPLIWTFRQSSTTGKALYFNGGAGNGGFSAVGAPIGTSSSTSQLVSYAGSQIGGSSARGYYYGDLAEIIIFNRALKREEENAIISYLGKKWGIVTSPITS